jgi:biotin-(acetyl-CoA carboxylase) ligase
MAVPFTTFTTRQWAVLTSKIDKLFIGIGIGININNKIKKINLYKQQLIR